MKKIIKLTESDLIRIVKRVINENLDSDTLSRYKGQYYEVKLKPLNMTGYVFKKGMDYDEIEKIMSTIGSSYKIPTFWDRLKDTFNQGHFWTGSKHGTYNIGYYDFKDKRQVNGHRFDEKNLMVIKK